MPLSELPPGTAAAVEVGGRLIALFHAAGTVHAIDDTCPHGGAPLSEGELCGTEVTCPWHDARFDVCTGRVLCPPARDDVRRYDTRVEGGRIWIRI